MGGIAGAVALTLAGAYAIQPKPTKPFEIVKVIDGDTIKVKVNGMPSSLPNKLSLRINGIDTPEKSFRAKCDVERQLAQKAKEYVEDLLQRNKDVEVTINGWGKFGGRILGDVTVNGQPLSKILIDNGMAVQYKGRGVKFNWCPGND